MLNSYEVEIKQVGESTRMDARDRRSALETYSEALSSHLVGGWRVRELVGEASAASYRSGVVLELIDDPSQFIEIWLTETALTRTG